MSGAAHQAAYTRPVNWIRRGGSELLRATFFRAQVRRHNPRSRAWLRQLESIEFAPPETLAALQLERLRDTVAWACSACPYWAEAAQASRFDPRDLKSPGDLAGLPILTKKILREQAERLLPQDTPRTGWRANASGGSTGTPVQLFQDSGYWNQSLAAQWFIESWWGIRPGEASAWIWGADRDLAQRSWKEKTSAFLLQERALNAFTVSEEQLHAFLLGLARWQPPLIAGYATALDLCARFLLRHPEIAVRPRALRSTAEVLRPDERARITQAFHAPVYDQYGSRESNFLAAECHAHQGLHVNNWSRYLELVDGAGRPVPAGVPGRVLVTDLSSRATALLRYENGDIGVWSGRACACGRSFPMLEKIVGRKSDFIHAPGGRLIHGEFFTHLFYAHPEVQSFQVVQEALDRLRVEVELAEAELPALAAALRPAIAAAMGPGTTIEFQRVDDIARPASGKHRFTRSLLDLPWPESTTGTEASK